MSLNASPIPLAHGEQYWHLIQAKSNKEWGNVNLFPGVWLQADLRPNNNRPVAEDDEESFESTVLFVGLILKEQHISLIGLVDGCDLVNFTIGQVLLHIRCTYIG